MKHTNPSVDVKGNVLPGCAEFIALEVFAKDQMLKSTCIPLGPDQKITSTKQAIGKNPELKTEPKIQAAFKQNHKKPTSLSHMTMVDKNLE